MCKEVGKYNAYISNNWIHCSRAERQQKTNYYNSNLNEKKWEEIFYLKTKR